MIVLFACIENSCRSQIAEALGKNISQGKIEFYSAGSKPSGIVNPMAIKLLSSQGVHLLDHKSNNSFYKFFNHLKKLLFKQIFL